MKKLAVAFGLGVFGALALSRIGPSVTPTPTPTPTPGPKPKGRNPLDLPDWERRSTLHAVHPEAYPYFVELLEYAKSRGHVIQVGSAVRTCAEQAELLEKGWTKAACSWHLGGRAIDIALDGSIPWTPAYDDLGEWWQSQGGSWGGTYPGYGEHGDYAHFQWTPPPLKTAASEMCGGRPECEEQYMAYWAKVAKDFPEV